MRRFLFTSGAAFVMCLVPLSMSVGEDGRTFQVTEACGQATSCARLDDYICSTFHNDYFNYVCYTGCSGQQN